GQQTLNPRSSAPQAAAFDVPPGPRPMANTQQPTSPKLKQPPGEASQKMPPAAAIGAPIAATMAQPPQSKTAQPFTPRLGLVSLVNNSSDFVLIDIGTAPAPAQGTRLQAYSPRGGAPAAELSVSNYQRRPFLIADIISGDPKVGDSVVQFSPRSGAANAPQKPAASGFVAAEMPVRSQQEPKENKPSKKTDSMSSGGTKTIFFEPPVMPPASSSDSIIPGLPLRR
ncbi:MAG: hypothetical protein WCL08_07630, partial [Verrucomicrobiota bacterium]